MEPKALVTWRVERLGGSHVTRGFRCGDHRLDIFLKRHALENDRKGLGTTYVAADDATLQVLGYVTLCTMCLSRLVGGDLGPG